MEPIIKDYTQIKGWAVDADPENDPTYPMKHRSISSQAGAGWKRPSQQSVSVEILRSNERQGVPAVFGTATPPSGVSGMLRRAAFKYSESSYGHWLPLMLADRVNTVEGVVDDLRHGRVPNIFKERGWKAEWKYNRKKVVQNVLVGAVLTYAAVVFLRQRSAEHPAY